jgi:hypothetical protein
MIHLKIYLPVLLVALSVCVCVSSVLHGAHPLGVVTA